MTDRCQLNLRLDGRRDLLETIKEVAADEGLSLNAWVILTLEQVIANPTPKPEGTRPAPAVADDIELVLDTMLDKKLAAKLASFEERLGKIKGLSDSPELFKPNPEVADSELQTRMGNLQAEREILTADYAKLLESSTHVTNKLREEVQQLRSQLETERADRSEIEAELSELKQNSAPAATLFGKPTPDAATILSQLRAKRKKSKTDLADLEVILEMLED
jgi:chromosome segregation ATPase